LDDHSGGDLIHAGQRQKIQWTRQFGTTGTDTAYAVAAAADAVLWSDQSTTVNSPMPPGQAKPTLS
jgi:hypothetical protein